LSLSRSAALICVPCKASAGLHPHWLSPIEIHRDASAGEKIVDKRFARSRMRK
jgi:hypothetical protein